MRWFRFFEENCGLEIKKIFKISERLEVIMPDVNLVVNEKNIPLKDFMQEMLTNIILGYLKSTKGVPENIKKIKIEVSL